MVIMCTISTSAQIGRAPHQRFDQSLGLGAARLNVDAHAGLHAAQRFFRRSQFFLYSISQDIDVSSSAP